jgi:hypothetical protein
MKEEKHFGKRVKRLEIVEAEAVEMNSTVVAGCLRIHKRAMKRQR